MQAAEQWAILEEGLGTDWVKARLSFAPEGTANDAAAILAPLGPGRVGSELRFDVTRAGSGPERLRNLLERLDQRRVWGTLSLIEATREPRAATPAATISRAGLPRERLGPCGRTARPGLERSSLRARAGLERPPAASSAARRTPEPDPKSGRDRAPIPGVGQAGLRGLGGHGQALPRADGRRRDHRAHLGDRRAVRHGERGHPGPGLAPRRTICLDALGAQPTSPTRSHASARSSPTPACRSGRVDRTGTEASRPSELHLPRLRPDEAQRRRLAVEPGRHDVSVVDTTRGRAPSSCTSRASSSSPPCRPRSSG